MTSESYILVRKLHLQTLSWVLRCTYTETHVYTHTEAAEMTAAVAACVVEQRGCWLDCGGGGGSSWQTCPGWRARGPIFTTAQHPHITTAVPTSLVCPLSGIAGLSAHSLSPQLHCIALSSLCVSSHLLRAPQLWPSFWFDRWLVRTVWIQELWDYFTDR